MNLFILFIPMSKWITLQSCAFAQISAPNHHLVPRSSRAYVRIVRNNLVKQRHIALLKLGAICLRKQSFTSVDLRMSASSFQLSIHIHLIGMNQRLLWHRRIGSSKKTTIGFIIFACKNKTFWRIGSWCQHLPGLLLSAHSHTACLDGHIWPNRQIGLNALNRAWILRWHVRLKLLKIISVVSSFCLSIELGSRSEIFIISKIHFHFSVFVHRRRPNVALAEVALPESRLPGSEHTVIY